MFKFLEEKGYIAIQGGVIISFKELYRQFSRKKEHVYLLKKTNKINEDSQIELDEFGFAKKEYKDIESDISEVFEIKAIVQRAQEIDINEKGVESNPLYYAYCEPTFHLKQNEINNYRIKYVKPYETLIMKILEYNPNLFLGSNKGSHHHHIRLKLLLEKKYG